MRQNPPSRWTRRGRPAVLALLGASALIAGTATVRAVAGDGSDPSSDDVGYVGGPSYLDPSVAPYYVSSGLETYSVPPIELISRRSDVPGDLTGGFEPSLSADGRFVAYTTLVPGTSDRTTVMLRDRGTGELIEATSELPEFPGRSSRRPVLSADGCVLAVATTTPYDVFRDDDHGSRWDVYRETLPQCAENPDEGGGTWELMSTGVDGTDRALNNVDPENPVGLSEAGTVVAFAVIPPARFGAPDAVHQVFVADATVAVGTFGRVVAAPGLPADPVSGAYRVQGQWDPALSTDGRFLAFTSDARADQVPAVWGPALAGGTTAVAQVYVWDRHAAFASAVLVSAEPDGNPAPNGASEPAISADGRFVAFVSAAVQQFSDGLDASCTDCPTNVFVLDRDSNVNGELDEPGATAITAVSITDGQLGDGDSSFPTFALDGRLVGYVTRAHNLAPGAVGTEGTFVVTDTRTGVTTVSTVQAGDQRAAAVVSGRAVLSDAGRTVVVQTSAPNVLGASVVSSGSPEVVALTSTPAVRIDDVDVGITEINAQAERTTTITNAGPGAFVPAAISSTSAEFVVSGGTCQVGTPVAAGDACTISLLFNASTPGFASSQLVVAERGVGAVSVVATVSGSGGTPQAEIDPSTLTFNDVLVGTDGETSSVKVRNVGDAAVPIITVTIGGSQPTDFVLSSDGCSGRTVPAAGACVMRVMFHPTGAGMRSAVLLATAANGSVIRSVLSGRGFYQPTILTAPASLESGGKVRVGGSGLPADVDIAITWETGHSVLAHTDINGAFDVRVSTDGVVPGVRRIVVADAVVPGTTPRFAPLLSTPIRITEGAGSPDANSPAFD